jgi:hypothetical protein
VKTAQDLIAEATMGMIDLLPAEHLEAGTAIPRACMVIFAYDEPDDTEEDAGIGRIRIYCTDASWWHQLGLLHGALKVHEQDTFRSDD